MTKTLFLVLLALAGTLLSGMATWLSMVVDHEVAGFLWFALAACGWSVVLGGICTWIVFAAMRFYERLPDHRPPAGENNPEKRAEATKPLYLLVKDGGDGSRGVALTMDRAWIDRQQARHDNNELEYDDAGVDADGFHYQTIQVPADATYESLGISPYHIARR